MKKEGEFSCKKNKVSYMICYKKRTLCILEAIHKVLNYFVKVNTFESQKHFNKKRKLLHCDP